MTDTFAYRKNIKVRTVKEKYIIEALSNNGEWIYVTERLKTKQAEECLRENIQRKKTDLQPNYKNFRILKQTTIQETEDVTPETEPF